ncbi:MAG: Cys-Gln thioester bond-forming surface protein, partial [Clostridia bacterium]
MSIVSLRSSGYGYKQGGKKVWKIAEYDSLTDTTADLSRTIYCIKAGPGFGSTDMSTGGVQKISKYTQKFNLKNAGEIATPYSDVLPTGENYNKLLWVLDNLYVMPQPGTDNTTAREEFLRSKIPSEAYYLLTDDDIDVVQQLAIWYFTNPTGDYHYNSIELSINSIVNDDNSEYKVFEDLYGDDGWDRQDAASALYEYYIKNAPADYTSTNLTTKPIEVETTNAKMQTIGNNYVAGPYKINDKSLNIDYAVTATYTDIDGTPITPTLGVKDTSGNIVTTSKSLKELVGTEFYLIMPTSSGITGINMTINSSYTTRTATYWSVEDAPTTEQPVVIVEETPYSFSDETSIVVPKPFDLSLRKYITEVNGVAVDSREPEVDVSGLKAGTSTTAIYEHSKTPIKVAIGDVVTYTIRVYNEGSVDGYVEEITDHLPANLELIVDDATNIKYGWKFASSSDFKTVTTTYLSKTNEITTGENKIAAFNGTSLDYREVQIKCKVIPTTLMPSKITNIAEITKFTDGDGNTVTDRDSQENNVTLPTGTELENYKDAEINRGETYIPGQQDDDDFEKLTLKEFDLALRKFITGVNDEEITSRIPSPDLTALKAGTSTTATYNHSKTPIKVTIGDIVIYTIRVYNEGEVDGYAEEITDHLPDQLEFLPDNSINQEYGWKMYDAEGNETTDANVAVNIKTTYLSKANETTTGANKIAAFNGTTLSYKEVRVVCKVVSTDPMPSKITNIAEITKFTDGNGNTVTDRDSQENNVTMPSDLPGYKDD